MRAISSNQSEIAAKASTAQSTVSRWLSGDSRPDARTVIALARAYSMSPVAALVAAGYLESGEITDSGVRPRALSLHEFTDHELAVEMLRRVDSGTASSELTDPLDSHHPATKEHEGAKVTELRRNDGGFIDDALHGLDTAAGKDETQADEYE